MWCVVCSVVGALTHPDLPELPVSKPLDQLQGFPWDLPHIFGLDGQVCQPGHALVAGHNQTTAQPGGPGCNRTERGDKDTGQTGTGTQQ